MNYELCACVISVPVTDRRWGRHVGKNIWRKVCQKLQKNIWRSWINLTMAEWVRICKEEGTEPVCKTNLIFVRLINEVKWYDRAQDNEKEKRWQCREYFWNALKKQKSSLRNFEKWPQRTTQFRKTMRSENKPILHLHFTKVRLMLLIQGGNRNLRRRDDYSWVCGCSFPRDHNSEVQESLWNWVGFTFEPFSFMHVQMYIIALTFDTCPGSVGW